MRRNARRRHRQLRQGVAYDTVSATFNNVNLDVKTTARVIVRYVS